MARSVHRLEASRPLESPHIEAPSSNSCYPIAGSKDCAIYLAPVTRRREPVRASNIPTSITMPGRRSSYTDTSISCRLGPGENTQPPGSTRPGDWPHLKGGGCCPAGRFGYQTRHSPGGGRCPLGIRVCPWRWKCELPSRWSRSERSERSPRSERSKRSS